MKSNGFYMQKYFISSTSSELFNNKKKEEERAGEMSDKVNFIVSEEKGVGANKKLQ